ncbi:hypothetical protein [Mucilaginibacter sp.]|uniref:hypothetical protein n=1 Tax=Mucilaginibacter sp. TaxID=1882438 RepID=UPI00283D93CD|nr:hypothetical protein [Mucilaginibacter sp.]MDR3697892.1 hypothetical protein [Mucilaginibacter sp.]
MVAKTTATAIQKENFKLRFAEIIKNNSNLKDQYTIQFFETAQKSNYVFYGLNGKTINILATLSLEEAEKYKILKFDWQN